MGFAEELMKKYGKEKIISNKTKIPKAASFAQELFEIIEAVFDTLPICSLIESKIFVCHGGLFNTNVLIPDIEKINRFKEVPHECRFNTCLIYIFQSLFPILGNPMTPILKEDAIFEQLLWSDPRDIKGYQESNRGAGVEFGEGFFLLIATN